MCLKPVFEVLFMGLVSWAMAGPACARPPALPLFVAFHFLDLDDALDQALGGDLAAGFERLTAESGDEFPAAVLGRELLQFFQAAVAVPGGKGDAAKLEDIRNLRGARGRYLDALVKAVAGELDAILVSLGDEAAEERGDDRQDDDGGGEVDDGLDEGESIRPHVLPFIEDHDALARGQPAEDEVLAGGERRGDGVRGANLGGDDEVAAHVVDGVAAEFPG